MRRLLYVAGTGLVGWGAYGLATTARHPQPVRWLRFFVGAALAHDLIIAPLVILVGVIVARFVSARWRPYVVTGLVISGVVTLVALPFVRGYGIRRDNPSIQPLDYTRGWLLTLAAVWAGVIVVAVVREGRARVRTR